MALNVFDTFHIVFALLDVVRNNHQEFYPEALLLIFPYFHYPLYRLSLCCSIFIVVSITVERFLAITRPHYRLLSNLRRALGYIVPCALLALLLNFSKFFETETASLCLDFRGCGCGYHRSTYVRPTQLRLSQSYILWYTTWTWVSLTSLLPFLTLLTLNFTIWRRLGQAQAQSQGLSQPTGEKTNLSSSTILLCTVATFLVCHSPRYPSHTTAMCNPITYCCFTPD